MSCERAAEEMYSSFSNHKLIINKSFSLIKGNLRILPTVSNAVQQFLKLQVKTLGRLEEEGKV